MKSQALLRYCLSALLSFAFAAPACASELFGGVAAHDVDTGLTASGIERGVDFQLGWRGEPISALGFLGRPSPHVFGSVNSAGDTNFAAAGLNWKLGQQVYVRPGVGIAVHDGSRRFDPTGRRIDFGSRVLFELELGLGVHLSDRVSAEASWVHLSHGQLFGRNNPGIDNIGLRLNYRFR